MATLKPTTITLSTFKNGIPQERITLEVDIPVGIKDMPVSEWKAWLGSVASMAYDALTQHDIHYVRARALRPIDSFVLEGIEGRVAAFCNPMLRFY